MGYRKRERERETVRECVCEKEGWCGVYLGQLLEPGVRVWGVGG